MAIQVSADGLSVVTNTSEGKCDATIPDVCYIPTPSGKTPVPFPNMVESKNGKATSVMTKINGGAVHCQGSYCEPSTGDEGGVLKGMISGCTKGKAVYMKFSPTVRVEGRPVCRKSDIMIMNNGNTMSLAGMNQPDIGNVEGEDTEIETKPFTMQFQENLQPLANTPFKVVAAGRKITGTTDGDGNIDIEIPKFVRSVKIKVGDNDSLSIDLTDEEPQGKKATQQRLANLGVYGGMMNGYYDSDVNMSTLLFQELYNEVEGENGDEKLKPDGEPGPITEEKLKEKAGF